MPENRTIKLFDIIDVDATQARAGYVQSAIDEYAEMYTEEGQTFPAIVVCNAQRAPGKYHVIDGHHRLRAARKAGLDELKAEIIPDDLHSYTTEQALYLAASQNREHGLQRTNADKRRAIEIYLLAPDGDKQTQKQVTSALSVSSKLYAAVRQELEAAGKLTPREKPSEKAARAVANPENENKSNREIAEAEGIDEKTVRQVRKNGKVHNSAPDTRYEDWTADYPPKQDNINICAQCGKRLSTESILVVGKNSEFRARFCDKACAALYASRSEMMFDGDNCIFSLPEHEKPAAGGDSDYFDPQSRPSIAKVTDDTRRVIPDVEKPSSPTLSYRNRGDLLIAIKDYKKMLSTGKTQGKITLNVEDETIVSVAKIIALFEEKKYAINIIYLSIGGWLEQKGKN